MIFFRIFRTVIRVEFFFFKFQAFFLQVLAVEYYHHNLVGKASQGDTFYVIFSDFLEMYKTLKKLKILKKNTDNALDMN